MINVIKRTGN